jgi:hypothetical protein
VVSFGEPESDEKRGKVRGIKTKIPFKYWFWRGLIAFESYVVIPLGEHNSNIWNWLVTT